MSRIDSLHVRHRLPSTVRWDALGENRQGSREKRRAKCIGHAIYHIAFHMDHSSTSIATGPQIRPLCRLSIPPWWWPRRIRVEQGASVLRLHTCFPAHSLLPPVVVFTHVHIQSPSNLLAAFWDCIGISSAPRFPSRFSSMRYLSANWATQNDLMAEFHFSITAELISNSSF